MRKLYYRRLSCCEYKEGVNAQFNPPIESLVFPLKENEKDIDDLFDKPLGCSMNFLNKI